MRLPNAQPISKQSLNTNGSLLVHHFFYTLQGEGPFAGVPAVFVRLAGCNLRCPQCDTDYTSETPTSNRYMMVDEIEDRIRELIPEEIWKRPEPMLVVVSGGEPFRQNIGPLVLELAGSGYIVQIETNGTLSLPALSDEFPAGFPYVHEGVVIVCSPKTGKIDEVLLPHVDAFKYVLNADDIDPDGLPIRALGHGASPRVARPPLEFSGAVYLQPADAGDPEVNLRNQRAAVESCLKHGYTLCLQTQKIVNLE